MSSKPPASQSRRAAASAPFLGPLPTKPGRPAVSAWTRPLTGRDVASNSLNPQSKKVSQ